MAALARWPCIPFINAAPLDPNFGLHALAAASFSGNHPSLLMALGYPDGISAHFIAIPTLLMAKCIGLILNPIAATNISVWLWLALQGIGTVIIFKDRPTSTKWLLCTAVILNPVHMVALGNGQWENIASWPILWAITSLNRKKWRPFLLAMFLCASCSPYVLVAALIGCVPFIPAIRKERPFYYVVGMVLACSWLYYSGADDGTSAHIGPAPSNLEESAQISGLLLPTNHAEDGGIPLSGPKERLQRIRLLPSVKPYNSDWPWRQATAASYLGIALLILGGLGWVEKKDKKILVGIGISILLAMGGSMIFLGFQIPLPWALTTGTPLKNMAATYRFLVATVALLLFCLSSIQWSTKKTSLAIFALMADALLISPAHWPLPALEGAAPSSYNFNQDAVAFWPASPLIAPHSVIMMSLVLNKPLSLFEDPNAQMPAANGEVAGAAHQINKFGETPDEWRKRLLDNNITQLIQFRNMVGERAHPFYAFPEVCDAHFCVISLAVPEKQ